LQKALLCVPVLFCAATLLASCTKKQTAEDVLGLLQSDRYHLVTVRLVLDGEIIPPQEPEVQTERFFRDGDYAIVDHSTFRMISKDNSRFSVYDMLKLCKIIDVAENDIFSYTDLEFVNSGKEEFNAEILVFQEYATATQSGVIRFFEKDGRIIGMRIFSGGRTFDERIVLIDTDVPDNVFEIPDDYEIQDNRTQVSAGAD
jgi:hypothetical protein